MGTVDMLELVLSAGSSARAAFPGRQIDVVNEAADIPLVKGDPDRLHQVLLNLVSNALRHGGEEAKVKLTIREEAGRKALMCLSTSRMMARAWPPRMPATSLNASTARIPRVPAIQAAPV